MGFLLSSAQLSTVVSTILPVTTYGSMLLAGRRSYRSLLSA